MFQQEPLLNNERNPCSFGTKITSDYKTIINLGRKPLTDLLYRYKFVLIKGLGNLNAEQFWDLANLFGNGGWDYNDYSIGQEPCVYANEKLKKAYAPYDNIGKTGKALGDGEMSWHIDIPLWPSHQMPMRSFYAVSIPDNKHGVTRFADRAYAVPKLTAEQRKELEKWRLLYQSWYFPGTSLTYIPVIQKNPVTNEEYLSFTSFSNSLKEYSHEYYKWKVHGWIFGAERDGVPQNADIVSWLHKLTIIPENIYDHHWEEQDFLIYTNVHMIHARTPLRSDLHKDKLRSFYRMNVFNSWQRRERYNVF
jgi:alpha-ketoglutarate-dependent taurine dioxygenase